MIYYFGKNAFNFIHYINNSPTFVFSLIKCSSILKQNESMTIGFAELDIAIFSSTFIFFYSKRNCCSFILFYRIGQKLQAIIIEKAVIL